MKKIVIPGFFILAILLTFIVVKATASMMMPKVEVNYRKLSLKLSETEIDQYNSSGAWKSPLVRKDGFNFIRYDEVRETRSKTIMGWSTKIDTTVSYVNQESCGCR